MSVDPAEPDPSVSSPPPAGSGNAFYAELFNQLPVLVVRLTTDGLVLETNTQVTLVTGYAPDQLVGRNFWATLFPGKLFVQVPRFISPTAPWGLFRDYPMALRTRNGIEKIIAWTRFLRHVPTASALPQLPGAATPVGSGREEIVCIGLDLTNRLTAAETQLVEQLRSGNFGKHGAASTPPAAGNNTTFPGSPPGFLDPEFIASLDQETNTPSGTSPAAPDPNAETIEPLAISPPPPPAGTMTPESLANLQQALELLAQRLHDLQISVATGQSARLDLLGRIPGTTPAGITRLAATLNLEKAADPRTLGLIETMQQSALTLGKLAGRGKASKP